MSSISWMPSWVESSWTRSVKVSAIEDSLHRLPSEIVRWECQQPCEQAWEPLTQGLIRAGERLRALPIRRIVRALDAATGRFRYHDSSHRRQAVEAIRDATGLAAETIHHSLDIEMNGYRAPELWTALQRNLGDPRVLDGFREDFYVNGFARAVGPRMVTAVATGNVPGLALQPIGRSLLVKAPVLLKVARGEPTFAAQLVRELNDIDSEVADAVVVSYWEASDGVAFDGALRAAECVIIFGSEGAVASIRKRLRPDQQVIVHGHKFSGGMITRAYIEQEGLTPVAERIACDVSAFDQHACIAPKVFVVEGDEGSVDAFGEVLAAELGRYAKSHPAGIRSAYEAASLAARQLAATWNAACGSERVWSAPGLDFNIVRSAQMPPAEVGGHRFIVLVPADTAQACVERLGERATHLQNVVVGATSEQLLALAEPLAVLGACRVCPPGRAADPTMIWHHDGRANFAAMVRWCDIEGLEDPARRES